MMDGIMDMMDMSLSKLRVSVMDREAWHATSPWDHKELDMTEPLKELNWIYPFISNRELKSPVIIVDLTTSPCNSIRSCLT